jgi:hypothetical protein
MVPIVDLRKFKLHVAFRHCCQSAVPPVDAYQISSLPLPEFISYFGHISSRREKLLLQIFPGRKGAKLCKQLESQANSRKTERYGSGRLLTIAGSESQ